MVFNGKKLFEAKIFSHDGIGARTLFGQIPYQLEEMMTTAEKTKTTAAATQAIESAATAVQAATRAATLACNTVGGAPAGFPRQGR